MRELRRAKSRIKRVGLEKARRTWARLGLMATDAEILAIAVPQLERDEGVETNAYLDTKGIPTIGVGHVGREVHLGLTWTDEQVDSQLQTDIGTVFTGCDSAIPWWRNLDPVRADVLVNIAFNVGVHGLLGFKHMLSYCHLGGYVSAGMEIEDSELAPERRARLAKQMSSGVVQ